MPRDVARRVPNPIKDRGTSKRRTKEITDHARPRSARPGARETVTGQGGSPKGHRRPASSGHPGEHGGVKFDTPDVAVAANSRKGKQAGRGRSRAGLAKAPSRKWGRLEGRTRTGKSAGQRRRVKSRRGH